MEIAEADLPGLALVGQYRHFGELGPAYCIRKVFRGGEGHQWMLKIEVVGSGEILDYPFAQAQSDPIAS
ncbi:MAG: DUF5397 family protein [Puniceicoccales bacterium]